MKEVSTAFRANCANLRGELDLGPTLLAALAAAHSGNKVKHAALTAGAKRQSYVSGIVSLYGLLEESVNKLLVEIADAYCSIHATFLELPERTRTAYTDLTLRCLSEGIKTRLRPPLEEKAALHSLVSNADNLQPRLLSSVFTYSTANYRFSYIAELMLRLDLDVSEMLRRPEINEKFGSLGLDFRSVDAFLEDLVERRNEVAHSYQTDNLVDVGTLRAYLEIVETFVVQLHKLASERLLRRLTETSRLTRLGKVVHVWTSAIGIDMASGELEAPCTVILVREASLIAVDVLSLQVDSKPVEGRVKVDSDVLQLGAATQDHIGSKWEGAEAFVASEKWLHLIL
jgi:hypothetical protein